MRPKSFRRRGSPRPDAVGVRARTEGSAGPPRLRGMSPNRTRTTISAMEAPVVVASNRGPVSFDRDERGRLAARRGSGGLVTALSGVFYRDDTTWVSSAMTDGRTARTIKAGPSSWRLRKPPEQAHPLTFRRASIGWEASNSRQAPNCSAFGVQRNSSSRRDHLLSPARAPITSPCRASSLMDCGGVWLRGEVCSISRMYAAWKSPIARC